MFVHTSLLLRVCARDSIHVSLLVLFRISCNVHCCLLMIYLYLRRVRVWGTRCPAHVLLVSMCRRVTLHIVLLMHPAMHLLMFLWMLISSLLILCSVNFLRFLLILRIPFTVMAMFLNTESILSIRCNPHPDAKFILCRRRNFQFLERRLMSFLPLRGSFPVRVLTARRCFLRAKRGEGYGYV